MMFFVYLFGLIIIVWLSWAIFGWPALVGSGVVFLLVLFKVMLNVGSEKDDVDETDVDETDLITAAEKLVRVVDYFEIDYLQKLFRIEKGPDGVRIMVKTISSTEEHEPIETWVESERLPIEASQVDIDRGTQRALNNPFLFVTCIVCGRRTSKGRMNSDTVCQRCIESPQ